MSGEEGPLPSSCSLTYFEFDAFLSFKQEDTGDLLAGLLYEALVDRGVLTVFDEEDAKKEMNINRLHTCIEVSKVFVPIFSINYAQSRWCLQEIAKMVECRRCIVPVFLGVDPSEVRYQTGTYGSYFAHHEVYESEEEVKRWRQALKEAGSYPGFHFSKEIDSAQSLQLFCYNAFVSDQPPQEFAELSGKVAEVTGGLPLELEETGKHVEGIVLNLEEGSSTYLSAKAFEALSNLRMLRANFVNFEDCDFHHLPEKLKWLEWRGCPLESLPLNCKFKKLSVLILSQSNISQLWKEQSGPPQTEPDIYLNQKKGYVDYVLNKSTMLQVLNELKVLDLSSCSYLSSSPSLASVPNLQKLILDYCSNLTEVDESIGCLKNLTFLSMRMCENLNKLPKSMHHLVSLKILNLRYCSKLSALPEQFPSSLITLDAKDCTALKITPNFSSLTNLETLNLQGCKNIIGFSGLGDLKSIKCLLMDGCEGFSCGFLESFKGKRFKHLEQLSTTASLTFFESTEDFIFLLPFRSINDPLQVDNVHCHGHAVRREGQQSCNSILISMKFHDNNELVFVTKTEAYRDTNNDLGDQHRGYCYSVNVNGFDETVPYAAALCDMICVSTSDGSLLTRVDIKLRHRDYWTKAETHLQEGGIPSETSSP
ncbi:Toll/interleukin-1 receptor-like protein [Nymphaea thermarum]|nr:Toll/interleukin-1 receptor-like protein [Nymphaea thermarum]